MNNLNKNISMPNDWLSELKICSNLDNINAPISYIKNEIEMERRYLLKLIIYLTHLNTALFLLQKLLYLAKIHIFKEALLTD